MLAKGAHDVPPREFVSIRQHTSAYVSIRQHTSASGLYLQEVLAEGAHYVPPREFARSHQRVGVNHLAIRQHTSACVSRRQHMSAYVSIRQHASAYVSIRLYEGSIKTLLRLY